MTTLALALLTLAAILLPIGLITAQQRRGRQATIARAWNEALTRQQNKHAELDRISSRLERSLAAEQKLLSTVSELKQRINTLESSHPDQDGLRQINSQTEQAINQIADVLESQIDNEGEARLTELANALAERHSDAATALVRLQDVLGDGSDSAEADSLEAAETPTEDKELDVVVDDATSASTVVASKTEGLDETIEIPTLTDTSKQAPSTSQHIH